jgi:hypothetical protein
LSLWFATIAGEGRYYIAFADGSLGVDGPGGRSFAPVDLLPAGGAGLSYVRRVDANRMLLGFSYDKSTDVLGVTLVDMRALADLRTRWFTSPAKGVVLTADGRLAVLRGATIEFLDWNGASAGRSITLPGASDLYMTSP